MAFEFLKQNGKAIGSDGWTADNDQLGSYVTTGLYRDGVVVAVLVAEDSYELIEAGNTIVTACNAHDQLVAGINSNGCEIVTDEHGLIWVRNVRAEQTQDMLKAANEHRQNLLTASKDWGRDRELLVTALRNAKRQLGYANKHIDCEDEITMIEEALAAAGAA